MDNLDLTGLVQTKDESLDFLSRLSTISEKIYETNFNLEGLLTDQFGMKRKDKLIALLRNNNVNIESSPDLQDFFNKVQTKISSSPVVSLTIAFDPTEDTLKKMSEWFSLNTKKQFLFDIKIDKKVVGGAAISVNGKYLDFSIKPQFEKVLSEFIERNVPSPSAGVAAQNQNIPNTNAAG